MWVSVGFSSIFMVGLIQVVLSYQGLSVSWLHVGVSALGILVVSFSMIREIQLIMGGEDKAFSYSVDDYALAATQVYFSIAFLIIRILELMAFLRGGGALRARAPVI
jgi:hypothetical protein